MPKPKGLFSDFLQYLISVYNELTDTLQSVLTIKSIAKEEYQLLLDELKAATEEFEDFEEKVRTLRTRVVRADVVFKLFDEIRTGDLKKWATQTVGQLKTDVLNIVEESYATGQAVGAIKTTSLGGFFGKFLKWMQAIKKVYTIVALTLHALRDLVPIVHQIRTKLQEFESIILRNDKPEVSKDGPHRTRKG